MTYRTAADEGRLRCARRDETHLLADQIGEARMDRCPDCQGLWISSDELRRLKKDLDLQSEILTATDFQQRQVDTSPPVDCPRCSARMTRKLVGQWRDFAVDVCGRHGIWLDDGELRQLVMWFMKVNEPDTGPPPPIHDAAMAKATTRTRPTPPKGALWHEPSSRGFLDEILRLLVEMVGRNGW